MNATQCLLETIKIAVMRWWQLNYLQLLDSGNTGFSSLANEKASNRK